MKISKFSIKINLNKTYVLKRCFFNRINYNYDKSLGHIIERHGQSEPVRESPYVPVGSVVSWYVRL